MLQPHRDFHLTSDTHQLLETYLSSDDSHTITLQYFDKAWPETPSNIDIQSLYPQMDALVATPHNPSQQLPCTAMWEKIHAAYTPSNHPSHITCTPPVDNTPPPAILATMASYS